LVVQLGFEAGGAFGPATRDFLREVARVAGAQASTDLYHWSAMVWGEHWQQRLSLVLARGQASLAASEFDQGHSTRSMKYSAVYTLVV
jgi:hypothetical protein